MVQKSKLREGRAGFSGFFSAPFAGFHFSSGKLVSIIHPDGAKVDLSTRQRLADRVLSHRKLIGNRRWGMVQLYYRAGLSQAEIGQIFGICRQMVNYEMRESFRIVTEHLTARRKRLSRGGHLESVVDKGDELGKMP